MPEGLEVELYRRAAGAALGRPIARIDLPVPAYVRGGHDPVEISTVLVGDAFTAARRRGKLLLLDAASGVLGLRFGMTGRLIVDGHAAIERLEYASDRDDPSWDRLVVTFGDGGALRLRDQRRLGSVELDPDEDALGADVFAVDGSDLGRILSRSSRPLKARLLDQSQLAGLGNLLVDEILWRASLDPTRPADSLNAVERRRLLRHLRATLEELLARGGSHTGDLHEQRHPGGRCPRDGAPLTSRRVGGRTTYACTYHQRAQD